jgi:hypothetical protein
MGAVWATRLRWRLKGASMWPAFAVFTVIDAILLNELPVSGDGPGGFLPGFLIAGFLNLFLVAVPAPLLGRALRRRRADIPRQIATDYAGTALLALLAAGLLIGGLIHRPEVLAERADNAAQAQAVVEYVQDRAPEYGPNLMLADSLRLAEDLYRTCVPGEDPRRPLCLIVETDRRPPLVRRDGDLIPNSAYR